MVVSFLFKNIVVVQRKDTYYNADREKELGSILMKEAILTAKIKHKKGGDIICPASGLSERIRSEFRN